MRIVLAFDSFKGSLSGAQVGAIVAAALRRIDGAVAVINKPMADGGEGTAEAVRLAAGGEWVVQEVMGPRPEQRVQAGFLRWPERGALVEMASASGLTLLPPSERNPLLTTTYGTGELVRAALESGARRLWLAVGGSATVDGGVGMATALGWRFLDVEGKPLPLGGGALERLAKIMPPERAVQVPVEVLCDVDNPLCGPEGAAAVYGPQKGATPEMVERLDRGLRRLAECVKRDVGKNIADLPGGGAGGGLAAGAVAFLNASLVSGIDTIMRLVGLEEALTGADWVITGEGAFDEQSLRGKVVHGVARMARRHGVRVAVIAGQVRLSEAQWRAAGIELALELSEPGVPLAKTLADTPHLLALRAEEFLRRVRCAQSL